MRTKHLLSMAAVLPLLGGCSIMLAGNLTTEHPPERLVPGKTRGWVDSNYGFPVAAGESADGTLVEQIQFEDGVPEAWKHFRIVAHTTLDYVTYCLWEIVGTPLELASLAIGNPTYVYYIVYGDDDAIDHVASADSPEGQAYSRLPWSVPRVKGVSVNEDHAVRNMVAGKLLASGYYGRIHSAGDGISVAPVALEYDAKTRMGKLSVKFSEGGYEEARKWAKQNIETLAKDKNIALVTGEAASDAVYYSLGETLKDGNILEIEFKTE